MHIGRALTALLLCRSSLRMILTLKIKELEIGCTLSQTRLNSVYYNFALSSFGIYKSVLRAVVEIISVGKCVKANLTTTKSYLNGEYLILLTNYTKSLDLFY